MASNYGFSNDSNRVSHPTPFLMSAIESKRQNLQRDLSGMRSSSSIPHPPTFYQQNCGCNPFRLLHNVTIPSKFSPQVEHPPINASFVHIPQQPIPIAGATSDGSKDLTNKFEQLLALSTHQMHTIQSLEAEMRILKTDNQKMRGLETEVKELQEWKLECSRKAWADAESVIAMKTKLEAMEDTLGNAQELLHDCEVGNSEKIRSMSKKIEEVEAENSETENKYRSLEIRIEESERKQEFHSSQIQELATCSQGFQADTESSRSKVANDMEVVSKEIAAVKTGCPTMDDVGNLTEKVELVRNVVQDVVELIHTCEQKNENSLQSLLNQMESMKTWKDEMQKNTIAFQDETKELVNMLQIKQEESVTAENNNSDNLQSMITLLEAHCAHEFASLKCTVSGIMGTTYQEEEDESSILSSAQHNFQQAVNEEMEEQLRSIAKENNARLNAMGKAIDNAAATQALLMNRVESLRRQFDVSQGERLRVMLANPLYGVPVPTTFDSEEFPDAMVFKELPLKAEGSIHSSDAL